MERGLGGGIMLGARSRMGMLEERLGKRVAMLEGRVSRKVESLMKGWHRWRSLEMQLLRTHHILMDLCPANICLDLRMWW